MSYLKRQELLGYVQFFGTSYNQKKNELIRQQGEKEGHLKSQDQQWVNNPAHEGDDPWQCEWELNEERYKVEEALNKYDAHGNYEEQLRLQEIYCLGKRDTMC